ncbi:MFS transporter [Streptomyces scabiei]|uniref:MFS transporter n=1 Tax=Streptomyces scabiei TaxID=1930 RepID=UPI0029BBE320|nr:MFS transporter [Streptomyces scabiei]MDX3113447.1 MFS transporter [Streptomyces scabiei]
MGNVDGSPVRRPSGRPVPPYDEDPAAEGPHRAHRPGERTGVPPARADRDLRILWWVNAVDGLGSQASGLVLPLLLLDLGHSPGTAGSLASAAALSGVVLGPLVAIPADQGRRRRLMTGSAALAALCTGVLALTCLGRPALWVVMGLALAERLCAEAYEAASRGALVHVAATDELPRAAAGLQVGDQISLVVGPVLGGVLFQLSRPLPFLADSLSYAVAALGIRSVRAPLDSPARTQDAPVGCGARRREPWSARLTAASAGVVTVARSPVLRLVLVWTSTAGGALTLLFYTALFRLGADDRGAAAAGGVLAVSGAAGLVGALVAAPAVRRLGATRLLTLAAWLLPVPCGSLLWADGAVGWGAAFAGLSLLVPLITVVLSSVAVAWTPVNVQSRTAGVLGAVSALATAGAPALAAFMVTVGTLRTPVSLCTVLFGALAVYTQVKAPGVLRAGAAAAAGTGDGHG